MLLPSLIVCLLSGVVASQFYGQPEQIHLSHSGHGDSIWVTWVTQNQTASFAYYGVSYETLDRVRNGSVRLFDDPGTEHRRFFIHRVLMDNLVAGTFYYYQVGSEVGVSSVYRFQIPQHGQRGKSGLQRADLSATRAGLTFAIYGDLGNENAQSLFRLQRDVQKGRFDAVLHTGDFAYDLSKNNGRYGDEFFRQIEPIAAYVPYMPVPGNHEDSDAFLNYKARFTTPNSHNNYYYSFDMGLVHVVAISTEVYGFVYKYGTGPIFEQYHWLKHDLQLANANRHNVPWVVTVGHRPMYCSNSNSQECEGLDNKFIRDGLHILGVRIPGLEKLFFENGVDLEFWGHEHSYERMWPVYKRTIYNKTADPYHNPPAPVHIVTGSAGCRSRHANFSSDPAPWSAARSSDYGYSLVTVHNATTTSIIQVSTDQNGQLVDEVVVTKTHHRPTKFKELQLQSVAGVYIKRPTKTQ